MEAAQEAAPSRYDGPESSYRLAFTDSAFLLRDELRPVRMQLELLKPDLVQQEMGIESTIVIFGSARIPAPEQAARALLAAQAEFAAGRAEKTYWAVVRGGPTAEAGVVDAPLLKRTERTGWRMVVDPAGQRAVTEWRVLGRGGGLAWLEMRPRTGRTHQVRAHAAALGCPLLGDALYGGGPGKLHLLARGIRLLLDPPVEATAPVPAHMRAALRACGVSPA